MNTLRLIGRWLADWRTGATFVATCLVLLLGITVADGRDARNRALRALGQQATQAKASQEAATRRIDLLTGEIGNLRLELDQVLAATTDEERQQAVANAAARSTTTTATTTPANPGPSAPPRPSPAPEPTTTTTTAPAPPTTSPPTTAPCTTLPVVGACAPGRASRSATRSEPTCGGWESQVAEVGDWNVADVCTVMRCESGFDPLAENGRYKGLMQVDGGSLDGVTNLTQAFALWDETRTWRRWTCKPAQGGAGG